MNHKTTPDERFVIKVYEIASSKGDPCTEIDYRAIAAGLGIKETALKNIIKSLAQANLIKKVTETSLRLTLRGVSFAEENS